MNPAATYLRLLALFVCLTIASGIGQTALAGNLPLLKYTARSGAAVVWNVEVDPSCLDGNAYYSLRFQASLPTGVAKSDRTLRVEVYSNSNTTQTYDEHVTYYLKVPEGSAGVAESLEIPQRRTMQSVSLQVFEDGEKLLEQRFSVLPPNGQGRQETENNINVLVIDKDMVSSSVRDAWRNRYPQKDSPFAGKHNLPDLRAFSALQPSSNPWLANTPQGDPKNGFRLDDAGLLSFAELSQGTVNYISPLELGSRWLMLSNADFIFISQADLVDLKTNQEPQFEALARWCLAGGNLIVYDATAENSLAAIDALLSNAVPNTASSNRSWLEPQKEDYQLDLNPANNDYRTGNLLHWLNLTAEQFPEDKIMPADKYMNVAPFQESIPNYGQATPAVQPVPPVRRGHLRVRLPKEVPFQFRRYGFGQLIAWKEASDAAFPGKVEYWNWLLRSIQADKKVWYKRHGMSHHTENNDYWNFLIPGIGQAPVFMFMGVIGLFMVLIGPTNFHLLKRFKRVSLLLVTVPLGALIFTLGLVFFAIFSDGFASQARIRSFTKLEDGRAVSMSRQMVFAAFVPSSGMQFPSDTAIYPLHHRPWEMASGYNNQARYQSDSEWTEQGVTLRSRYLGSREQRQFVVLRSTECSARLDVKEIPQPTVDGKTPSPNIRVTNRLGVPLLLALIRGSTGEFYLAENLAADQGVELSPLQAADLLQSVKPGQPPTQLMRWNQLLGSDALNFPTNFSTNQYSMLSRSRYDYRYGYNNGYGGQGTPLQTESMLEQGRLQALQAAQNVAMLRNGQLININLREYFVITPQAISGADGKSLAPLGLPSAQVKLQSHITHGNW